MSECATSTGGRQVLTYNFANIGERGVEYIDRILAYNIATSVARWSRPKPILIVFSPETNPPSVL